MPTSPKLLAWIDPRNNGVLAAFIGAGATGSRPATRVCSKQGIALTAGQSAVLYRWLNTMMPIMSTIRDMA